ncbi:hypothetical protein AAMO2058_000836100 [Amorphochlora amoebiformis]|mmetsp:Transcript_20297/g.32164  ORF Transcript_20297/g.32164 Transcript_20297/m.32164 type:complete len:557 (-) Transcript_20297:557-2227(-)
MIRASRQNPYLLPVVASSMATALLVFAFVRTSTFEPRYALQAGMVVQHPRVSFAPRTSIPSQSRRSKPPRALDTQPGTYFWGERHSQTKMVATIGPPTRSEEMIEKMWERGADVFRIPMCYTSQEDCAETIRLIRNVEARHNSTVGILMDLQGPKLRIGKLEGGSISIEDDAIFTLDLNKEIGDKTRVNFPYPRVFQMIAPGTMIPMGGGRVTARVISSSLEDVKLQVIRGGRLNTNDRVNVPKVSLPYRALTDEDINNIEFGLEQGVDWVALSCVRTKEDVLEAKRIVGLKAFIMAKIETEVDPDELVEIIREADSVMVARGDLGVDTNVESVPPFQKKIVAQCKKLGTPVVISTQMLESMVESPTPTRAEASDVANAIYDGADAVMLSAETSIGSYPVEAVDTMEDIIRAVEASPEYLGFMKSDLRRNEPNPGYAMIPAARQIARDTGAKAIVCFSSYGRIPRQVSRERTTQPVLTLSEDVRTARMLNLVWGVCPVHVPSLSYKDFSFDIVLEKAKEIAMEQGLACKDDKLVVVASKPGQTEVSGANTMRIVQI